MGNTCSFFVRKHSDDESKFIISKEKISSSNGESQVVEGREFHNDPESVYVLAKDDIEKKRLNEQHLWIKENFGNLLEPEILHPLFEKKIDVYDVGCGAGTWILDMATEFPNAQYYGSDICDIFPQKNYPKNCRFAIGNVLHENPFGKRFDFVQMRYFAVALRANEWDEAYASLFNQLKPGGYLQILDTSIVKCTTEPELLDINQAFSKLIASKGQDYDIGSKLAKKMETAGFNVICNNKMEVPMGWGSKRSVRYAENMRSLYISIAPGLAEQLHIDVDECIAKINRACDSMGPTKATVHVWSYLAQKPLDAPKAISSL
ncbi:S-adenosyl-L-methionine-dependent methyltransferase [Umbelopsis sp. AD052]|nr:S-adenosyl-L-methionine-dependent methyltransferase [Umbelopsis sp. AD052]